MVVNDEYKSVDLQCGDRMSLNGAHTSPGQSNDRNDGTTSSITFSLTSIQRSWEKRKGWERRVAILLTAHALPLPPFLLLRASDDFSCVSCLFDDVAAFFSLFDAPLFFSPFLLMYCFEFSDGCQSNARPAPFRWKAETEDDEDVDVEAAEENAGLEDD